MVNRRAFFEIFFYNRPERSREMMEAAEGVWRAYMKKYGLGLDASNAVEPTYEEVKEITILANAAIEMVEKQMAEAAAEEAKRKKLQKEAWDLGIYPPADMAVAELEAMVLKAMNPQVEEVEEAPVEEPVVEAPVEVVEEVVEEVREPAREEAPAKAVVEAPAKEILVQAAEKKTLKTASVPAAPVVPAVPAGKVDLLTLWIAELTSWCQSKGMQCITTADADEVYLHVYFPHKKDVFTVGKWCFKTTTGGAELAAEITRLFAYCEGFADCFEKLVK